MIVPALVRQHGNAVRITVRVQPRASRSAIEGVHDGAWRDRVQAAPVNGAANDAVRDLLAEWLRTSRRQIRLISGASGRIKVIEIDGIPAGTVQARLVAAMEDR